MKIGIDVRLWSESGVGRYTRNLVQQLSVLDRENEYVLFVLKKDFGKFKVQPFGFAQGESSKFKVIEANIRWHTIKEQFEFPQILNRENLDLMHFPYFSVPIFYNKPFVVTIHDLILHNFSTGEASTLPLPIYNLKLLGYKFIISQAARKAQKIITVSNATKKEIIDHLGVKEDKVMVTYEGIDPQIPNPKSEIRNNFQNPKIQNLKRHNYFLYVGNAYPHKNLTRMMEAFKLFCHPEASAEGSQEILRSTQNDIKLIMVGKEDYFYKRLKEKIKNMGMEGSVIFYGEASDEELGELYKNAKALIMPSLMEGFGLPALEAMANECLVLCSDIPVFREIYGNVAIYFDPYNIQAISKKLEEVCSNDNYNENLKKGLDKVKMFSWKKMAQETLRIYESCSSTSSE